MLYVTTTLDLLHCYDESSPYIVQNGTVYHCLTPDFLAWIYQAIERAHRAAASGCLSLDTLTTIKIRLQAILDAGTGISDDDLTAALSRRQPPPAIPPGIPHPDVPPAAGPPADPAAIAALNAFTVFMPPDEQSTTIGCHVGIRETAIIRADGFPLILLSAAEVAVLDRWTHGRLEVIEQAKRRDLQRAKAEETRQRKQKQKRLDEVQPATLEDES